MEKDSYFYNLDALRGLCAILVALFHSSWISNVRLLPFVSNGWLFVDFFFVLSGFVIAQNYALRIDGPRSLGAFVIRRFFRLYPLHLLTFTLAAAITIAGLALRTHAIGSLSDGIKEVFRADALQAVFLVHGLGFGQPTFNAPSWSISAEFWTYLAFGIIVLCAGSKAPKAGLAMLTVGTLALIATYALNHPAGLYTAFEFGFLRCLAGFSVGVVVWLAYWRTGSWWPKPKATTVILIASSLSIWLLLAWLDRSDPANGLVLPLFAGIIYACATDRGSLFKTALETKPARFLGRVSYSIYMLHTSVLMVVSFAVTLIAPDLKGVSALPNTSISRFLLGDLFCLVYVLGIVASAAVTFHFVEEPFRRFGNRLSRNLVRSGYPT
jgi:peptidoglycan/LPS O-acetylase OafA/YrhL